MNATPFKDVRPVGKVKAGKQQLRIEEARQFTSAALTYYGETGRPLAIGVLLALTMGLRTREVLERVVRDLDDGAKYLWIDTGKTARARRHLDVPVLIQPYLLQLMQGKGKEDLLFGNGTDQKVLCSQTMWKMVKNLCKKAGVPRVCTHSLRGLWATLAVESGDASHVVAANLGHHSFEMTERHYAQGSAMKNVATARVLGRLGNKQTSAPSSAREQLEQLDEGELARLLELLAGLKKDSPLNN